MTGVVRFGINNIYTVDLEGREIECRIKGKVLKEDERSYNPIAVGDVVTVETDAYSSAQGVITAREPRRNALVRWNGKKNALQTIAANVDRLAVIASFAEPPFRPRFVDRMLVAAHSGGVEPFLVINKCDLVRDGETLARAAWWRRCGYTVIIVSTRTGEGMAELEEAVRGRTTVFAGQSGTGKSSLLNALAPELEQRVGEISAKLDRGAHTTCFGIMLTVPGRFTLIDTPGIRELDVADVPPADLKFHFPEFAPFLPECKFPSCLHREEPGCALKAAVEAGEIPYDRYDSYLRLLEDLIERENRHHE
jgi:ribosome biogenesis GTPase / thiamine phosphate phosphatase